MQHCGFFLSHSTHHRFFLSKFFFRTLASARAIFLAQTDSAVTSYMWVHNTYTCQMLIQFARIKCLRTLDFFYFLQLSLSFYFSLGLSLNFALIRGHYFSTLISRSLSLMSTSAPCFFSRLFPIFIAHFSLICILFFPRFSLPSTNVLLLNTIFSLSFRSLKLF